MTIPVTFYDEINSTNAEARRRAQAGEAGPLWIVAGRQTAGKGRRERTWESPPGNLAATLLVTVERPAAEAAQLSFVAALAVADTLIHWTDPAAVRVKWPNDVMIGDEKVSGILLETGPADGGGLWVAIGVGINLAHKPEAAERPAACLADHMDGPPPAIEDAAEVLAAVFDEWLGLWDRLGFVAIADSWTARAYGLGEACVARLADETVEGVAEGLDEDGALRLRLGDGSVRRISAGDVFFGGA